MLQRLMLLAGMLGLAACSRPATEEAANTVQLPAPPAQTSAAVDAAAASALPLKFVAFGNEPFWNVRVDGDALHWSSPENMDGIDFTASTEVLPLQRRYNGQLQGQAVSLTLGAGPCSDGMSDQVHPWRVSWSIDGRVLEGCARAAD